MLPWWATPRCVLRSCALDLHLLHATLLGKPQPNLLGWQAMQKLLLCCKEHWQI
jgi:hypothetical protein